MRDVQDFRTTVLTFRLSTQECAELDAFLQREGGTKSELCRDAVLARIRGIRNLTEMFPAMAASLDREIGEMRQAMEEHVSTLTRLAGAAVASSAMLLDDGKRPSEEAAQVIEDGIRKAMSASSWVVDLLETGKSNGG